MTQQFSKPGKAMNILLFIVILASFVWYVYSFFATKTTNDLVSDLILIGLVVSFVGGVLSWFNIKRGSTFIRGLSVGVVIGIAIIAIIGAIIS